MTQRDLSLVTVFFEAERDLLLLQAKSLARFMPEGLCSQIVVIDNGAKPASSRWRSHLLTAYGPHASLVSFRSRDEVVPTDAPGWVSQQLIKLAISRDIETAGYVVLDSKNHLVAPLVTTDIVNSDGRWRLKRNSYASHPLREFVTKTLTFVGLEPNLDDDTLPGTTTPFVFDTQATRELWTWLGAEGNRDPARTFVDNSLIEFVLYGSRLKALGTVDTLHDDQEIPCTNVWPKARNRDAVAPLLATATSRPFLSIHRSALARLSWGAMRDLVAFWCDQRLFKTRADAWVFLLRCRIRILSHVVLAKLK